MQDEIISLYHLAIEPAKFAKFHELVKKIVAASRQEANTLTYEYVVNADRTVVHIVERYRMAGVLPHVEQTFAPYAGEFLSLVKIERLFVYGDPTPEVRAKLDGLGAIYLTPFEGFTR